MSGRPGLALLGPFLATPLRSGKLTSHDLREHSEIHQGLGPYGPGCSYTTASDEVMPGNCTYRMYHIPTDKKPKLFIEEQPNGRMIAMDCRSSHLSLVIFLADIEIEITACSCVSKSLNCLRNQKFYYLDLTNRLDLVRMIYVFTHIYKRVRSQTKLHQLHKCGCCFHC